MTKNRTVNFLTGPSIETLAELAIACLTNLSRKANMEGSCWILIERSNRWDFRLDNGEHCSHLALLLLRLCSRNAPPSWMLRSRRPLSPHSRSAIHLEATLNLFVKMAVCRPVVLPPPSLSCLHPASSVPSPRRCTLRSGPTRSHAAPPITICEAQHPRHASIWKHVQLHGHLVSR